MVSARSCAESDCHLIRQRTVSSHRPVGAWKRVLSWDLDGIVA